MLVRRTLLTKGFGYAFNGHFIGRGAEPYPLSVIEFEHFRTPLHLVDERLAEHFHQWSVVRFVIKRVQEKESVEIVGVGSGAVVVFHFIHPVVRLVAEGGAFELEPYRPVAVELEGTVEHSAARLRGITPGIVGGYVVLHH